MVNHRMKNTKQPIFKTYIYIYIYIYMSLLNSLPICLEHALLLEKSPLISFFFEKHQLLFCKLCRGLGMVLERVVILKAKFLIFIIT